MIFSPKTRSSGFHGYISAGRSAGAVQVAWAALGLVPCALFVSGALMWWNRARISRGSG
jgi:uncharacterized iron-regulated membrane protein